MNIHTAIARQEAEQERLLHVKQLEDMELKIRYRNYKTAIAREEAEQWKLHCVKQLEPWSCFLS